MPVFHHIRESEISQFDVVLFIQEDVFGFDVSVRHIVRVTVPYSGYDLLEIPARFGFREPASAFNGVVELATRDVLQHYVDVSR